MTTQAVAFANEAELVRSFAQAVDRFPVGALSPSATRLLVIGHETNLPGAGKGGNSGSIDLLAIDDRGELWVIEAKLARNPECSPLYVFANQLRRYAHALTRVDFTDLHGHLQDFVFGRRAVRPPADLAPGWLTSRSLEEVFRCWLDCRGAGGCDTDAAGLVRRVAARLRAGNVVLAVLTDAPDPALMRWSEDQAGSWQTAVLVMRPDGDIQVLTRTPPRSVSDDGAAPDDPPPFERIPQSFEPLPGTLSYVLNPTAFRLYEQVALPRLVKLLGDVSRHRPKQSSTSFGYALRSRLGLPLFLRIGRNDERAHGGEALAEPGQHALKVDLVFKWACDAIFQLPPLDTAHRQACVDSLWELTSRLVLEAGYKYKNQPRPLPVPDLMREFERGCSARTLLVERAGYGDGHGLEFGARPEREDEDAMALSLVFDLLEQHLPSVRPVEVLRRPGRVPYDAGPLAHCLPSIVSSLHGRD